ncbi:hypothetical protein BDV97DRAFT_72072 [Delphinella strobiligena]|nr:hypothetical protein BDV97DRAFT_72072 [Delphinella strobiligena]
MRQLGTNIESGYIEGNFRASQSLHSHLLVRNCATHKLREPSGALKSPHGMEQFGWHALHENPPMPRNLPGGSKSQPASSRQLWTAIALAIDQSSSCKLSTASTTACDAINHRFGVVHYQDTQNITTALSLDWTSTCCNGMNMQHRLAVLQSDIVDLHKSLLGPDDGCMDERHLAQNSRG